MVSHTNRDGGGQRLEPAARGAVPLGWLVPFSGRDEARRLAELQADNDLLNRMMWAGYEGEEWEELSGRLIAYGYAVMVSWLRKGVIFARCAQRGCLLKATTKSRDLDEARSLAGETVTVAVIKFKETVLIPRVWRPDGGASLETFFVGQCLIRFANVYRRWLRENGCGGLTSWTTLAVAPTPSGLP